MLRWITGGSPNKKDLLPCDERRHGRRHFGVNFPHGRGEAFVDENGPSNLGFSHDNLN